MSSQRTLYSSDLPEFRTGECWPDFLLESPAVAQLELKKFRLKKAELTIAQNLRHFLIFYDFCICQLSRMNGNSKIKYMNFYITNTLFRKAYLCIEGCQETTSLQRAAVHCQQTLQRNLDGSKRCKPWLTVFSKGKEGCGGYFAGKKGHHTRIASCSQPRSCREAIGV